MIRTLKPGPLRAAMAAFLNVPDDAIKLEHETGSLRKAVARAIRTYSEQNALRPYQVANDNEEIEAVADDLMNTPPLPPDYADFEPDDDGGAPACTGFFIAGILGLILWAIMWWLS